MLFDVTSMCESSCQTSRHMLLCVEDLNENRHFVLQTIKGKRGIDEINSTGQKVTLDPVIERGRKRGNAVSLGRNSFRMFLLSGYWLCLWKTACFQGNLLDY